MQNNSTGIRGKILVTGSSGFLGRNLCPILMSSYSLVTPTRYQLDLKDSTSVRDFLSKNDIDIVLHLANPNPARNKLDKASKMYTDSLAIFHALAESSDLYNKMIYMGSGAEYGKQKPIKLASEEQVYERKPLDDYGLAKQEMNRIAEESDNIYNLRLFGCYGPTDHCRKFITHCIRSILFDVDITIRKDCYFDYLYVTDLTQWIEWAAENSPQYHSYNATSGSRILLSGIAEIVRSEMQSKKRIVLLNDDLANEYTASNARITEESGLSPTVPLVEGIRNMISFEVQNFGPDTEFDGV